MGIAPQLIADPAEGKGLPGGITRIAREIVSFKHPRISAIKLAVADPNADLLRGDMTADEMREIIRRKLIEEGLLPPPVEH